MYPSYTIWLILAIALVCANMPFFTERMFIFLPMRLSNEPTSKSAIFYFLRFILWLLAFGAGAYMASNVLLDKPYKLAGIAIMVACFVIPGIATRKHIQFKNIFLNFFEIIFFMLFVGAIGFFIEGYFSNQVSQNWQFYAVGACIFLVMAFPGFVWRHLMNHPHLPKHKLYEV
ncbi:DUF2818 family protein [Taylorella asinigenitalis]|uniref:DUF2818 family protein n=1 Tax=Taylorella asinigenitalis TaxID=84590 RepID=UPI0005D15556|nr:DUF2818 family protein [Taylorella asinigenitalis]